MKKIDKLIPGSLCRDAVALLLTLSFLSSCASNQSALIDIEQIKKVKYGCGFSVLDYFPDAPKREFEHLESLFAWMNLRLRGGIMHNPGRRLRIALERSYLQRPLERNGQVRHFIWSVPSKMTKKRNPMDVVVELKGNRFIVTRIESEYRQKFVFGSEPISLMYDYCPPDTREADINVLPSS